MSVRLKGQIPVVTGATHCFSCVADTIKLIWPSLDLESLIEMSKGSGDGRATQGITALDTVEIFNRIVQKSGRDIDVNINFLYHHCDLKQPNEEDWKPLLNNIYSSMGIDSAVVGGLIYYYPDMVRGSVTAGHAMLFVNDQNGNNLLFSTINHNTH